MTIEDSESAPAPEPQAANLAFASKGDLEALVRRLVDQRCANLVDQRCANLDQRVGLLEGHVSPGKSLGLNATEGITGGADRFARTSESDDDDDRLKAVVGVPDDGGEGGLANRVTLIERHLENMADDKKDPLDERQYALPESTFSLLITQRPLSVPFVFGVCSTAFSISCLSLTLISSIQNRRTKDNPLGIPAGVDGTVRAAQFLGKLTLLYLF